MRHIGFLIATVVLSSACAYGEIRQVLRAEFANELDCPEVRVQKKELTYSPVDSDDDRYALTGCGVVRTYSCPPDRGLVSYDDSGCTWVEGDSDRPEAAPSETAGDEDALDDEGAEPEPEASEAEAGEAEAGEAEPAGDGAPASDE